MMTPQIVFRRFLTGLVLGCALGVIYGFLRPARKKKTLWADLVFGGFALWIYAHYGFGVCRGDLRMGYLVAPILGAFAWDRSVGRWLLPIFGELWQFLALLCRPIRKFFAKGKDFVKFLLARWKKWVTIKWRKHRNRTVQEGENNGHNEKSVQPYSRSISP